MIGVARLEDLDRLTEPLEHLGYEYVPLKRELTAAHATTHACTVAKSAFIREVEARAGREVPG